MTADDDAKREPSALLSDRFTRAVDYARVVHAGDVRKGTGVPYLAHLLSVSALVLEGGGDEDQAIAALLHDAAEDHGGWPRLDALSAEFGPSVAAIVEACSDSLAEDPSKKRPWWERKVCYLRQLESEHARAALISCADKLHNARAVLADYRVEREELWKKFNADAGRRGQLWYYRRVAEILPVRLGPVGRNRHPLGAELIRTVDELWDVVAASSDTPDQAELRVELEDSRAQEARLLEHCNK